MEPLDDSFGFVSGLSRLDLDDVVLGDSFRRNPSDLAARMNKTTLRKKNSKCWDFLNLIAFTLIMSIIFLALLLVAYPYVFQIIQRMGQMNSGVGSGSDAGASLSGDTLGAVAPMRIETSRMDFIKKKIYRSGLSRLEDLEDEESIRQHALQWLSLEDVYRIPPNDVHMLERYALAVFYYASRPQISKAHSRGDWNINDNDKWKGWMTDSSICHWKGLNCVNKSRFV